MTIKLPLYDLLSILEVMELLEDLDGYGLSVTNCKLLKERLVEMGFVYDPEDEIEEKLEMEVMI